MRELRETNGLHERRGEVRRRLKAHGLDARGLRVIWNADQASAKPHAQRLADLLGDLGPVFAAFGLYMASRTDLLRLEDCLVLAALPRDCPPLPHAAVQQLLERELAPTRDVSQETQLVAVSGQPLARDLLHQTQLGRLGTGEEVCIKIVAPAADIDAETELLPLLGEAFRPRLSDPESFELAVSDFGPSLRDGIDLSQRAIALDQLGHQAVDVQGLRLPKVHDELCTSSVLVTEHLGGERLETVLHEASGWSPAERGNLARQLCQIWLSLALSGKWFPLDLRSDPPRVLSKTQIALGDGPLFILPADARENLLEYVTDAAADEPNKALTCLLQEVEDGSLTTGDTNLRQRFRQIVGSPDGTWHDDGTSCLADTLFAHAFLVTEVGYRPLRHTTNFYRGLLNLTIISRRITCERDPLVEGLSDVRLTRMFHDFRELVLPEKWGSQSDHFAALAMLVPKKLNNALSALAAEQSAGPATRSGHQAGATNPAFVLLLTLGGLVVVANRAAESGAGWLEPTCAVLFWAVSGLLLWRISHA